MKNLIFLLLFAFTIASASAQKKTYFLVAYAQQDINLVCGTKVMINNAEISLTADEAKDYRNKYKKEIDARYSSKNGYKNLFVEKIKSN